MISKTCSDAPCEPGKAGAIQSRFTPCELLDRNSRRSSSCVTMFSSRMASTLSTAREPWLEAVHIRRIQKEAVVKQSRAGSTRYWVGWLSAMLLSLAAFPEPTLADAADGKGEANIAAVAIPPDTGMREPSRSSSVIIRGTRPIQSTQPSLATGPGNIAPAIPGFPIGPYTGGFEPSLMGKGWDSSYDYSGQNPALPPR